jgi:hypothetical protein
METSLENKKIEIGQEGLGYLDTTRKWTMFFAILGFVVIGLMLIGGTLAGTMLKGIFSGMGNMPGIDEMEGFEGMEGFDSAGAIGGLASGFMLAFIIIAATIYFFPLLFLFRFSRYTSKAIQTLDSSLLTKGLSNLKSYWMYMGILVIIFLIVYLLIFLIAGASLAFLS